MNQTIPPSPANASFQNNPVSTASDTKEKEGAPVSKEGESVLKSVTNVERAPSLRELPRQASSVSEYTFYDCFPEGANANSNPLSKKGESNQWPVKKVNSRAEAASAVHQINLETHKLLRDILLALKDAKETFLYKKDVEEKGKVPPPVEKTSSLLNVIRERVDPNSLQSEIRKSKVRVPVRPTFKTTSLTKEEKQDLQKILDKVVPQIKEAKELNGAAGMVIKEHRLADCGEKIVTTHLENKRVIEEQIPEWELDLRQLQGLL